MGQTAADSSMTIVKQLEDIEVVQRRSTSFVTQQPEKMVVEMQDIKYMPKFLGTSDPIRYLQSLPGVQTNNETTTGLHINGCDDHQTLVSINGAPVFYPNHLLGLYSTFISSHFKSISLEPSAHRGTMTNRLGGWVDFATYSQQPKRFSFEGNIGIVNSDITFTIPMGPKHALWISARSSYINWLYSKFLKMDTYNIRYHFQDYNLTYAGQLSERDQLVITGFFSRDKMGLFSDNGTTDMGFPWQNIVGSAFWNHRLDRGNWRTTLFYSSFDNQLDMRTDSITVNTYEQFATTGIKNRFDYDATDRIHIEVSLDYEHYLSKPLFFQMRGMAMFTTDTVAPAMQHGDELSLGADLHHEVCDWFAYNAGLHLSGYIHASRFHWAIDPRVSLHFVPAKDHDITLHYGIYHQYFHKSGLTGGGLPTDFFYLASDKFQPEWAHSASLRYTCSFLSNRYSASAELYFKQMYNITESTGNVLQVLNKQFSFDDYIVTGNGRNYGLNVMFQRNKGIITGYVSYTLGWARRSLPGLEGYTDYRYAASSERRHDLKVVFNSHFAKRWNISAMFVLATGLPYTEAQEAYFLNGKMVCLYSTYNGAHLPLYHRLDLSCSCDIIKTKEHELGINLSLYNAYAHKNAQFVVYRDDLKPILGTSLTTITPSISIYGKF
jgi:hypothetical protein